MCVFAPAPVLTITIELAVGDHEELHLHAGGQGFWVARLALVLGADVILCAPFGGETGDVLRHLVADSGLRVRAVEMPTPNASYVHDRRGGDREELWESGLDVLGRHQLDELYTVTIAEALAAGVCVLTGDQEHEIVDSDTYRRLASDLDANGVRVVADLSGELLSSALEGGLQLVKVSDEELAASGFTNGESDKAIRDGIEKLRAAGAEEVVVSRAGEGAIAYLDGRWLEARPPSLQVVDARGAGDSMTAALAVGLARGLEAEARLALATAAGALNVTRHGLGSGRLDAIVQLSHNVRLSAGDPS